jgi:DNA-binding response OmpR family regulator
MKPKDKILIVDDEPINLEFFDVMLSKLGFEVAKAENGDEALDLAKSFKPDLILLDNIMPGLTGWEVTKKLKSDEAYAECRDIPVIMFSAMDSVEDKIEGFELGVDDYITKPFNFSEVLARIRAVLRSRDLHRQVSRREKRIAVIESLNNSLLFFTRHVRKPVTEILEKIQSADPAHEKQMKTLLEFVRKEQQEILAALGGLEREIEELKSQESRLKEGDLALKDLEDKYRKSLLAGAGRGGKTKAGAST